MIEKIAEIIAETCRRASEDGKCGSFETCSDDVCNFRVEQTRTILEIIADAGYVQKDKLLELAKEILSVAYHGDYSNGNTFAGVDEGDVQANTYLTRMAKRLEGFIKVVKE